MEGTRAVFPGPRHARAEFATACDKLLQQYGISVSLQFDDVLTSEAGWRGEPHDDAVIDGVALAIAETCVQRSARTQSFEADGFSNVS
jgi:hypothetical protein